MLPLLVPPPRRSPPSQTRLNTLYNTHENGGAGSAIRLMRLQGNADWRSRGWSDSDDDEDDEPAGGERNTPTPAFPKPVQHVQSEGGERVKGAWRVTGVKGVLKQSSQCPFALDLPPLSPHPNSTPTARSKAILAPTPSASSVTIPAPTPKPLISPPPCSPKGEESSSEALLTGESARVRRVRLLEPTSDLLVLSEMRDRYYLPSPHTKKTALDASLWSGSNGIGGYRRTRDIYGGGIPAAKIKPIVVLPHQSAMDPLIPVEPSSPVKLPADPLASKRLHHLNSSLLARSSSPSFNHRSGTSTSSRGSSPSGMATSGGTILRRKRSSSLGRISSIVVKSDPTSTAASIPGGTTLDLPEADLLGGVDQEEETAAVRKEEVAGWPKGVAIKMPSASPSRIRLKPMNGTAGSKVLHLGTRRKNLGKHVSVDSAEEASDFEDVDDEDEENVETLSLAVDY